MERRAVLAALGTAAALAGCSGAGSTPTRTPTGTLSCANARIEGVTRRTDETRVRFVVAGRVEALPAPALVGYVATGGVRQTLRHEFTEIGPFSVTFGPYGREGVDGRAFWLEGCRATPTSDQ